MYEWTEDYVIKYLWSAAGYALIAIPVLLTRRRTVAIQTGGEPGGRAVDDQVANRTESKDRRLSLLNAPNTCLSQHISLPDAFSSPSPTQVGG